MSFFSEVVCKARAKLETLWFVFFLSHSWSNCWTTLWACKHLYFIFRRYGLEISVRSLATLCKYYRGFPGTERSVTAGKAFSIRHTQPEIKFLDYPAVGFAMGWYTVYVQLLSENWESHNSVNWIQIFNDVTLCRVLRSHWNFGGKCCFFSGNES